MRRGAGFLVGPIGALDRGRGKKVAVIVRNVAVTDQSLTIVGRMVGIIDTFLAACDPKVGVAGSNNSRTGRFDNPVG